MNQQRIVELWDKANSQYYQSESDQPLPQFIFAELIVQECANFIKEWERYQLDMADQCNGHFPTGGAGELKRHFGVEE